MRPHAQVSLERRRLSASASAPSSPPQSSAAMTTTSAPAPVPAKLSHTRRCRRSRSDSTTAATRRSSHTSLSSPACHGCHLHLLLLFLLHQAGFSWGDAGGGSGSSSSSSLLQSGSDPGGPSATHHFHNAHDARNNNKNSHRDTHTDNYSYRTQHADGVDPRDPPPAFISPALGRNPDAFAGALSSNRKLSSSLAVCVEVAEPDSSLASCSSTTTLTTSLRKLSTHTSTTSVTSLTSTRTVTSTSSSTATSITSTTSSTATLTSTTVTSTSTTTVSKTSTTRTTSTTTATSTTKTTSTTTTTTTRTTSQTTTLHDWVGTTTLTVTRTMTYTTTTTTTRTRTSTTTTSRTRTATSTSTITKTQTITRTSTSTTTQTTTTTATTSTTTRTTTTTTRTTTSTTRTSSTTTTTITTTTKTSTSTTRTTTTTPRTSSSAVGSPCSAPCIGGDHFEGCTEALAAGSSCRPTMASTACLQGSAPLFFCPWNNAVEGAAPDQDGDLPTQVCQICGVPSSGLLDVNTESNGYTSTVSFGPATFNSVVDESFLEAYHIYVVDADGQRLGDPVAVVQPNWTTTGDIDECCVTDFYTATVEVDLSQEVYADYDSLALFLLVTADSASADETTLLLPGAVSFGSLRDQRLPEGALVERTLLEACLTVFGTVSWSTNDTQALSVMEESIAAAAGVPTATVEVSFDAATSACGTTLEDDTSRRLRHGSASGRRTQTSNDEDAADEASSPSSSSSGTTAAVSTTTSTTILTTTTLAPALYVLSYSIAVSEGATATGIAELLPRSAAASLGASVAAALSTAGFTQSWSVTAANSPVKTMEEAEGPTLREDCDDAPSDWSSSTGKSCADYETLLWCTENGTYGAAWDFSYGFFGNFSGTDDLAANEACCGCGGGTSIGHIVEKLPFLKTDATHCAKSLGFGTPDEDSLSSTSDPLLDTRYADTLHRRWVQEIYPEGVAGSEEDMTIEWRFSTEKTLQNRFETATSEGEAVRWLISWRGGLWEKSGTWYFSSATSTALAMSLVWSSQSQNGMSPAGGAFGAASSPSVVDGNGLPPLDFVGFGNFRSSDASETACGYLCYPLGDDAQDCLRRESLESLLSLVVEAGLCEDLDCPEGSVEKAADWLPNFCEGSSCTESECCTTFGSCSTISCSDYGTSPSTSQALYVASQDAPEVCENSTCDVLECCELAPWVAQAAGGAANTEVVVLIIVLLLLLLGVIYLVYRREWVKSMCRRSRCMRSMYSAKHQPLDDLDDLFRTPAPVPAASPSAAGVGALDAALAAGAPPPAAGSRAAASSPVPPAAAAASPYAASTTALDGGESQTATFAAGASDASPSPRPMLPGSGAPGAVGAGAGAGAGGASPASPPLPAPSSGQTGGSWGLPSEVVAPQASEASGADTAGAAATATFGGDAAEGSATMDEKESREDGAAHFSQADASRKPKSRRVAPEPP